MEYLVIGHGGTAKCPECGGTMKLLGFAYYWCADCQSEFVIDGPGKADKEVTVTRKEHRTG